jgi:hypothetical protein
MKSFVICTLFSHTVKVTKLWNMRWAGHVAHMSEVEVRTKFWSENKDGRHHLRETDADRKIL